MADLTNRKKITTFPQSSAEYDKWIASGKEFTGGQWYESAITPSPTSTPDIAPTRETVIPTGEAAIGKQIVIGGETYPSQEWYDVNVAGKKTPVTTTPVDTKADDTATTQDITPGAELPKEGETRMIDGKEYKWGNEQWNPVDTTTTSGVDDITTQKADLETKLTEAQDLLKTTQTELATKTATGDKTVDGTKVADDTKIATDKISADINAKLEEYEKIMNDAFQEYFDQQSEYLKELQEQPTALEQLQKFREEQKLPQLEKELMGIDQTILDVEGLLSNIEEDIRTRTEGLPVTEASARRLTALEQAPLSKRLTDLIRGRQRVASGLAQKEKVVSEFVSAQQEDIERQRTIAEAKLGLGREKAEFLATTYGTELQKRVDTAQTTFDRAVTEDERRIAQEKLEIEQAKLLIAQQEALEEKITPEEVSPEIDTLANMYLRGESLGSIGATKKAQVIARAEEIKKSPEYKEIIKTEMKGDIQQAINKANYGSREDLINSLVPLYPELTLDEVAAEVYGAIPDVIAEESFFQRLFSK